jgi:hypothetical protein
VDKVDKVDRMLVISDVRNKPAKGYSRKYDYLSASISLTIQTYTQPYVVRYIRNLLQSGCSVVL